LVLVNKSAVVGLWSLSEIFTLLNFVLGTSLLIFSNNINIFSFEIYICVAFVALVMRARRKPQQNKFGLSKLIFDPDWRALSMSTVVFITSMVYAPVPLLLYETAFTLVIS